MAEETKSYQISRPISEGKPTEDAVALEFGERKNREGKIFYAPDCFKEKWEDLVKWFGEELIRTKLQAYINQTSQNIISDLEDTDRFNDENYVEAIANLGVRGETLEDLEAKSKDLLASFIRLSEGEQSADSVKEMMKVANEMKNINSAIEQKKEIYRARAAKRKDRQPAETATAVASAPTAVAA